MHRMIALLAILAGCASSNESKKDDIFAQLRGEIIKLRKERDALREKGAQPAAATATTPAAPEALPAAGKPSAADGPPAPGQPPAAIPAVFPFPGQTVGFLGRPPLGWGPLSLSIRIVNAATRATAFGQSRRPYCYLGFELDREQMHFVQPAGGGAVPLLVHVKEGPVTRTIAVIPPGETAYVLLDEPGPHSWRARCYEGVPRPVQVETATGPITVPVLQLTSEARGDLLTARTVSVDHWDLSSVIGEIGMR